MRSAVDIVREKEAKLAADADGTTAVHVQNCDTHSGGRLELLVIDEKTKRAVTRHALSKAFDAATIYLRPGLHAEIRLVKP